MNSKHSRSSAQLDVAKISLSSRVGQNNESPMIKRGAAAVQHQNLVKPLSNGTVENSTYDAYKKSFPNKGPVKDPRKNSNHGTAASVGIRSGASSMADASALNVNSNQQNKDGSQSPMPPNSAPETATEMSARRPNSKK